jgi:hypothetical protein
MKAKIKTGFSLYRLQVFRFSPKAQGLKPGAVKLLGKLDSACTAPHRGPGCTSPWRTARNPRRSGTSCDPIEKQQIFENQETITFFLLGSRVEKPGAFKRDGMGRTALIRQLYSPPRLGEDALGFVHVRPRVALPAHRHARDVAVQVEFVVKSKILSLSKALNYLNQVSWRLKSERQTGAIAPSRRHKLH